MATKKTPPPPPARIHEIAKSLELDSKSLREKIVALGFDWDVSNHMKILDGDQQLALSAAMRPPTPKAKKAAPSKAKAAAPPVESTGTPKKAPAKKAKKAEAAEVEAAPPKKAAAKKAPAKGPKAEVAAPAEAPAAKTETKKPSRKSAAGEGAAAETAPKAAPPEAEKPKKAAPRKKTAAKSDAAAPTETPAPDVIGPAEGAAEKPKRKRSPSAKSAAPSIDTEDGTATESEVAKAQPEKSGDRKRREPVDRGGRGPARGENRTDEADPEGFDPLPAARQYIGGLLKGFGLERARVAVSYDGRVLRVDLKGGGAERILGALNAGANPDVLDAMQTLLARAAFGDRARTKATIVDIEGFREGRVDQLQAAGERIARFVAESGKTIRLPAMNNFDRYAFHKSAGRVRGVDTESVGEGIFRMLHVWPYGTQRPIAPEPTRREDDGERRGGRGGRGGPRDGGGRDGGGPREGRGGRDGGPRDGGGRDGGGRSRGPKPAPEQRDSPPATTTAAPPAVATSAPTGGGGRAPASDDAKRRRKRSRGPTPE